MKHIDPACAQNRIRDWRLARGLSLQQVAEIIGTTRMTLSRLETGNRETTVLWLRRLAKALDVDPVDLLHQADNPHALSKSERRLINFCRAMSPERAGALMAVAETLAKFEVTIPND